MQLKMVKSLRMRLSRPSIKTKTLKGKSMKKVENVKRVEAATKATQEDIAEQKLSDEVHQKADEERIAESAKRCMPINHFG